jgi:ABC-type glycerol-3-phosphate transport system substrate-binding protein
MNIRKLLVLLLVIVLTTAACTPAAKEITVTIEDGECTLDGSNRISAGDVNVTLIVNDQEQQYYGISLLAVPKGKGYEDLADAAANLEDDFPPAWSQWQGDILGVLPGSQTEKTIEIWAGPLYVVCVTNPPPTTIGVLGPVKVVK